MEYSSALRYSRSVSIGSYDAYQELGEPSSFDILRSSILRSISKRAMQNQGFLENTYNEIENTPSQPFGPKYIVTEIEHYDRKNSSLHDDADSDLSDTEQRKSLPPEDTMKIKKLENSNGIVLNSLSINASGSEEENSNVKKYCDGDSKMDDSKTEEFKIQEESVVDSLKLARRKFNDTIFRDCSTYDITCGSVNLEQKSDSEKRMSFSVNNDSSAPSCSIQSDTSLYEEETYSEFSSNYSSECSDEQNSLSDTFFPNMISEENQSPKTCFQQINPNSADNRSPLVENMVEKYQNTDEAQQEEATDDLQISHRRKYSKRHRKRSRRKSKSKKTYIYECSKCGVSYNIPTKAMNNVACCLHCDLWTPVEPVFVKREKQTWNTCCVS